MKCSNVDENNTNNMKYLAVIYFEAADEVNAESALEVAVERLENFDSSIKVHDTHLEEDTDD